MGTAIVAADPPLADKRPLMTFRVLLIVAPPVVGLLTYRICKELTARGVPPETPPTFEEIVRTPSGGFVEAEPTPH